METCNNTTTMPTTSCPHLNSFSFLMCYVYPVVTFGFLTHEPLLSPPLPPQTSICCNIKKQLSLGNKDTMQPQSLGGEVFLLVESEWESR